MRTSSFISCFIFAVVLVPATSAWASDASTASQGASITPPKGLISVANNPTATAVFSNAQHDAALQFIDAYVKPTDIKEIEAGKIPDKRHYIIVLQPADTQLRFANPATFEALVGDMRGRFLGPAEVSHANAHMKAEGEDSKLIGTTGKHILVDETNCFAVMTQGKYKIEWNSKLPPMSLGLHICALMDNSSSYS